MMKKLKDNNSTVRFALIVAAIFSVLFPYLLCTHTKKGMRKDLSNSLQTVLKTTEQNLLMWIKAEEAIIKSWSLNNGIISESVTKLLNSSQEHDDLVSNPLTIKLRNHFKPILESEGYKGFFIITPDYINIGSMRDANLGDESLIDKLLLERAFRGETFLTLPQESDVPLLNSAGKMVENYPTMFLVSPFKDNKGDVIAVMTFRIDPNLEFSKQLSLGKIGNTGETYAFNRNAQLLSSIGFEENLKNIGIVDKDKTSILELTIHNPGVNLVEEGSIFNAKDYNEKPLTLMAESATKGESGVNLLGYSDYRGVNVIGAWKWNSEYNFGLATEIEFKEAYSTLLSLRYAMILTGLIGLSVIVAAYFYIRYSKNNKRLSLEDGLTGIANRRMLDLTLKNEFNHSMRYKKPLSILMIDVDFFKSYNDVFGHLVGDDALRKIAGLIKDCVHRKSDLVARYGGEEFCVVLPDTSSENAHKIAEKIREKVFAEKIPYENLSIHIGDLNVKAADTETKKKLSAYLKQNFEILVSIDLKSGSTEKRFWGSDLSEAYVQENAFYTT